MFENPYIAYTINAGYFKRVFALGNIIKYYINEINFLFRMYFVIPSLQQ